MQLAAAAVTVEHRSGYVECHARRDPDLPVRKHTAESEFPGHADIRGKSPETKHVGHQRHGGEQRGTGQRQMAILALRVPHGATLPKINANDHEMNRPCF